MNKSITRRQAMKATAFTAAMPWVVPSSVFGKDAPSNMLRMGSIGTGRMGHGDMKECIYRGMKLNVRVVAVCDVDKNRVENARKVVNDIYTKKYGAGQFEPCKTYTDYRELLARKDIDGVTISTPEHWHAKCAIDAANNGIGSYVQKPMTYSIVDGQKLVKAVRKNKVVLQVGSQQRSSNYFRMACEYVRNGRIGKLHTIIVQLPADHGTGKNIKMDVPSNLNYEMWMGPTAKQPYTEHRVHPKKGFSRPGWLQIEQYCRGMITGWGAHMFDIAQWGHGSDDSGPVEMKATAEFPDRGLFNVHTKFEAEGKYADGVKLIARTASAGVRFIGDKGDVWVSRSQLKTNPESIRKERLGENEIHLYRSNNHMTNFLECLRNGKDPICPVEVGHRSNICCVITHIAMHLDRKLKWDPENEKFIGDDEANKWLDYPHRQPWTF